MAWFKRVDRYLKLRHRVVWEYLWQTPYYFLDVSTDANWCGCKLSRKLASGGAIVVCSHFLTVWSKTYSVIAKSSAESERYGVVKGACEGLGATTSLNDLAAAGVKAWMHLDATAAKGIIERRGLNKVRHIETDVLWLQERGPQDIAID